MANRKSVCFNEDASISLFYLSQPPEVIIEPFTEKIHDHEQFMKASPHNVSYCEPYNLDPNLDIEPEDGPILPLKFIEIEDLNTLDCHFLLFIDNPGEYISSAVKSLHEFFISEPIQSLTIVRPNKYKESNLEDFKIKYEGVLIGVTFQRTEDCHRYITSESDLKISSIPSAKIIPGTRGEHFWKQHNERVNYLQGFFFFGLDAVDFVPDCLCYLASVPKMYNNELIKREIFSHTKEQPIDIIRNPYEERCIMRLEFKSGQTVKTLMRRCMSFDGKPVLVLPCVDRKNVEEIYKEFQVVVTGYSNAINPKEFLRILSSLFGPVVELNINFEGLETLVVFQMVAAAEAAVRKKELFIKNHKIKFAAVSRPYRLSGLKVHKGKYKQQPFRRPLELVRASYTFNKAKYEKASNTRE